MNPVRKPQVIDPDRILSDDRDEMTVDQHRTRAQELDKALHESCAYATSLWEHLDAIRQYLFESLPSDPRAPGPHPRSSAAPTGPDDEAGWKAWIATYAAATSILAGPHGDSGLGLSEAKHAAIDRREAPTIKLLAEKGYAEPTAAPPAAAEDQPARMEALRPPRVPDAAMRPLRTIAMGVLGALALRGLLVRRSGLPTMSR